MPQVTDNEDGTQTYAINSSELRPVKELLDKYVPGYDKALRILASEEVRRTLRFVKFALD